MAHRLSLAATALLLGMHRRQIILALTAATLAGAARADDKGEHVIVRSSFRSLDDPTWADRSAPADDLSPQFSFRLARSVYVGDPNSIAQIKDGRHDRPVHLPNWTVRDPLLPTAEEAEGREALLAGYYAEVMHLLGARPKPRDVGYWLRTAFVSPAAGKTIEFPWWDRISDSDMFVAWLKTTRGDEDFFDADQGWILRARRRGERLHFQYADLDTLEEYANLRVDRAIFLTRLEDSTAQVRRVVAKLKARLSVDPWT